jgi:plastocyanin
MLKNHRLARLVLPIVALTLAALGGQATRAETVEVQIIEPSSNFMTWTYSPNPVTVAAGDVVTWTNVGGFLHTVTADDGSFDSGALDPGGQFTWTASGAGTMAYHCTFHPWATGTVVVTGGASS